MTDRTTSALLHTLVLTFLACWPSALAGETRSAEQLVRESGVQGGLVVHVGGGSAERTAALRVDARYLVEGLERDAARVAETRAYLRKQGLLGPVTAVRWDGRHLPYTDSVVNLLVGDNLGEAGMDEVRRVLAPRGVALVKSGGKWTKTVKPWPDDIDEWTHYMHDASGNAVAHDARVGPPRQLQWQSGPRWSRSHEYDASLCAMVSSHGRLFYIFDEGPTGITDKRIPDRWTLPGARGFGVVNPPDLFVADGLVWYGRGRPDVASITAYDPVTGKPARTVALGGLITRGHHARCYRSKATDRYVLLPKRAVEFVDLKGQQHSRHNWVRGACRYGLLPCNGKTLAEHKLDAPPAFDALIAATGRLFLSTTDGRVLCLGKARR